MITSSKQQILSLNKISDYIYHVVYSIDKDFKYIPGQFVGIQINSTYRRAYSILKSEDGRIEFLINTSPGGIASQYFQRCKVGDENMITGPYGRFFLQEKSTEQIFLVCTGTGIVPYLAWLNNRPFNDHHKVFNLVYGIRYLKDDLTLPFLHRTENVNVIHCVTREEEPRNYKKAYPYHQFFQGRITDYLSSITLDNHIDYYVCGANHAVNSVLDLLKSRNIKNIYTENYG